MTRAETVEMLRRRSRGLAPVDEASRAFDAKPLAAFFVLALPPTSDFANGIYNAVGGTKAATGGSGTIAAVVSTLIMVQALALVGLELRARRHGKPSILGPTL